MEIGYVHVYTGNGKGKTTAALGLSVRALCAGKKVFIGQFIKGMDYSELKLIDYFQNLKIIQFGRDCFIKNKPTEEDIKLAQIGLKISKDAIFSKEYDAVILDEINIALHYKLISVDQVLDLIKNKPVNVELILTGRYAPKELIDVADLVTEMVEVKHYFSKGVLARLGIEY
ncbi:MAG: cob(I)yrinic acid a,c-diamide adenosyltransferase [Fervidobacterium sp.]